jgi:galactose mutarotase-like enzyme
MAVLTIENAAVQVAIDPALGARVLSLLDRRSGRDWIFKGPESTNIGEDAHYRADEAVGWDECFPTVAPWDASATPWARKLRDHGDLWGRPWSVDAQSTESLSCSYSDGDFRFSRTLSLAGETLTASYRVDNLSDAELPFLWALHGLLAVTEDDRIALDGIDTVRSSYLSRGGETIVASELRWPDADLQLDVVHPAASHIAAKLYASHLPTAQASVGGRKGSLDIGWDNSEIAHLGLWFNYGGWPAPGNIHHLALEPTTAAADHLGQALDQHSAITLAPGAAKSWSVTLRLRPPSTSFTDPNR